MKNTKPNIAIIVAMTPERVIGINNQLPWHLPADLKYFKKLTLNHTIIMGRKTFASIGKPLVERRNIVISRDTHLKIPGVTVRHSLADALNLCQHEEKVFIIGGAEIFNQALPLVNDLYLTIVHAKIAGDAFFPELNWDNWQTIRRTDHEADEKNIYPYSFLHLRHR